MPTLVGSLRLGDGYDKASGETRQTDTGPFCPERQPSNCAHHVRFGSFADMAARSVQVRFALKTGHRGRRPASPLRAISGSHSILVAAGEHWLRWSFGQPGLPQSFLQSREVFGPPIRAQHVFESGNT